jgi:hypothetical protein
MLGRKNTVGKIYPKYQPYPLSWDFEGEAYSSESGADSEPGRPNGNHPVRENSHDLITDSSRLDWLPLKPIPSNDERPLRPLSLLHSLFADRLDLLQRALEELESAKKERQQLVRYALDELDPEIQECEQSLARVVDVLNGRERRRDIERRLFELKRERRREALLSWRDLVWLKSEIRKLQREIDAIGRTARPDENQEAPT